MKWKEENIESPEENGEEEEEQIEIDISEILGKDSISRDIKRIKRSIKEIEDRQYELEDALRKLEREINESNTILEDWCEDFVDELVKNRSEILGIKSLLEEIMLYKQVEAHTAMVS